MSNHRLMARPLSFAASSDGRRTKDTTMTGIPVTADELHAFVDGELPPDRLDAVEAWLATHPDDAARVASWRSIGQAVHNRYDAVADEAVPKHLEIERLARHPHRWLAA